MRPNSPEFLFEWPNQRAELSLIGAVMHGSVLRSRVGDILSLSLSVGLLKYRMPLLADILARMQNGESIGWRHRIHLIRNDHAT